MERRGRYLCSAALHVSHKIWPNTPKKEATLITRVGDNIRLRPRPLGLWWRNKIVRLKQNLLSPNSERDSIMPCAVKSSFETDLHISLYLEINHFDKNWFSRFKSEITSLCILKVHKHEIILNFFFTQTKSLYALRKFSKKNSLLFLRFSPEFRCSNISAVTEHTGNQIFFERYPKKIFSSKPSLWSYQIGSLTVFSKFWFFIGEICILLKDFWVIFKNYSMRMLSIRGNDFIACWAYSEPISAHAQPAAKCEHFYMYNTCWAYVERILSHTEHTGN